MSLRDVLSLFTGPSGYLEAVKRIKTIREQNDITREQLQQSSDGEIMLIRALSSELGARVFELQESLSERGFTRTGHFRFRIAGGTKSGCHSC